MPIIFSVFNSADIPSRIQYTFLACPIPHTNQAQRTFLSLTVIGMLGGWSQSRVSCYAILLVTRINIFMLSQRLLLLEWHSSFEFLQGVVNLVYSNASEERTVSIFRTYFCSGRAVTCLPRSVSVILQNFAKTFLYNRHICFLPIYLASTWTKLKHPEDEDSTFLRKVVKLSRSALHGVKAQSTTVVCKIT